MANVGGQVSHRMDLVAGTHIAAAEESVGAPDREREGNEPDLTAKYSVSDTPIGKWRVSVQ